MFKKETNCPKVDYLPADSSGRHLSVTRANEIRALSNNLLVNVHRIQAAVR